MAEKKSILIVDDESHIVTILTYLLRKDHTIVGTAADGLEAIEKYKELSPDLVLLDILMPKMTGIEAVPEFFKINPNAKIVFISAQNEKHLLEKARELGCHQYVTKPFNEEKLKKAIAQAFSN